MNKRSFLRLTAATAALALAGPVLGQGGRPITLIVPFPSGGASDAAARAYAQALGRALGQTVIVENRAGANGAVGARALMTAAPDGQTLLWGVGSMVALPLLMGAPPYASMAELTPIAGLGRFTFALFVHPSVPAQNLADLGRHVAANPDRLSYATSTLSEYLAATQLMRALQATRMVRVPYRGGAQALPDLIEGRVQASVLPAQIGAAHARAGKLRALATIGTQRSALLPDTPTTQELGLSEVNVPTWQAVFGPPRLARDQADRLAQASARVMAEPELRAAFTQQGMQPDLVLPEALAATIEREAALWRGFVRDYEIPKE